MSRAGTSHYTAEQGGALFTGLPVAQTAGLRLKPGSPTTVFDDDRWDLSGLADAPVVMSAHRKILDFTMITNPRWRWVAREYLMARLAPRHPAVATLPQAFRTPINPHSLWADLHLLTDWFNYLTSLGISYLADVAQHHCQAYLAVASRRSTDPDRRLSPSTITARIRATQVLALYSEILTDSCRPEFTPWTGRCADDVAAHIRTAGNSVPPVSDTLLRPLLADSLCLLETIGPDLVTEASAARAADQREAAALRYLPQSEVGLQRHVIEDHRAAGIPAPRLAASALARRLRVGWDPADPLLHLAWHPVVAVGQRRVLETLRPSEWPGGVSPPGSLRPESVSWMAVESCL